MGLDILATLLVGLGVSLIEGVIARILKRDQKQKETTEQRISRLTSALQETAGLVTQIEQEIIERQSLAAKLEQDIKTYDELVRLRKSEVEAVAQLLRGEIRKESTKSFWQGVGVNFIFFALGVAVTLIVGR